MLFSQSAKSDSLFAIGVDLYNAGKYKEAIPLFEESDKLDKTELDSTSNRRDYSAMWLASCYYQLGDSLQAKEISQYYKYPPVNRKLTLQADSLANESVLHYSQNEFQEALNCELKCAEIEKSIIGDRHLRYWHTNCFISLLYMELGEYEKAIACLKYGIELFKDYYGGENSCNYISILLYICHLDYKSGNFNELEYYLQKSIKLSEKIEDKENLDFLDLLGSFSMFQNYLGNYMESIRICEQAKKLCNAIHIPTDSEKYNALLYRLARNYDSLGYYSKAIQILKEVIEIAEIIYGKDSQIYSAQTNTLVLCYYHAGEYSEGIRLGLEMLERDERLFGVESDEYLFGLNHLSLNYAGIGDYANAIDLSKKAVNIIKKSNKSYRQYQELISSLLISIIGYNCFTGKYNEAIKYEDEMRSFFNKKWGGSEEQYSIFLNNIALAYQGLGMETKALELFVESLKQSESAQGKLHPGYAHSLIKIANLHLDKGEANEAKRLGGEALEIIVDVLGKKHPLYSSYSMDMSRYYYADNDIAQYSHFILESARSKKEYIFKNFAGLTSNERKSFWEKDNEKFYNRDIHMATFRNMADSMIVNAYDGQLLGKGILLNSEIEMTKLIRESGDQEIIDMFDELQLNRLQLENENNKPINSRYTNTDSLKKRIDFLERNLIEISKTYGDYTKNLKISWNDIKNKLGSNDICVEFVSFPLRVDSTMYVAYVLSKCMDCPKLVPLFEEKQLKKDNRLYTTSSVSKLVWEPLAEYLEGVKNVYFSPSGELYNIGIESLPHWSEDCLMSDKWNMYRLSSTRQLAVIKDKSPLEHASVYGGVKYDTKEDLLLADSKRFQSGERSFNYELFEIADSLNFRSGAAYLPATKIEAEEIDRTLEQKKIATTLKLDTLATEGAFKDLSGKKTNLLHIATHGFYWTEKEAQYSKNLDFLMLGENQPKYVEDKALTRSGLLLAGANNALMGKKLPEGVDDGILTAKEISQLDLRGLDLVVLSACQTGLGEIKGDGVFGLQRGFKKAGANSLLMSLWKVDDEATRLLTTQFYKNLTSGMSKYESLKQAQKYVREYEAEVEIKSDEKKHLNANQNEQARKDAAKEKEFKKVKKYQDPYYWAAFIFLDAID